MGLYESFAGFEDNKPEVVIHERLKNCTSVLELAQIAEAKGFRVKFEPGGFLNDLKINEGFNRKSPARNHTIRSGRRFLETHPGIE